VKAVEDGFSVEPESGGDEVFSDLLRASCSPPSSSTGVSAPHHPRTRPVRRGVLIVPSDGVKVLGN